jgi:hypothetical protein
MISPPAYQVIPASLIRSQTFVPSGSVWLMIWFSAITRARSRAIDISVGSIRSETSPTCDRLRLASVTRSKPACVSHA